MALPVFEVSPLPSFEFHTQWWPKLMFTCKIQKKKTRVVEFYHKAAFYTKYGGILVFVEHNARETPERNM